MRRLVVLALSSVFLLVSLPPAPAGPVRDDYWAISWFEVESEGRGSFDLYGVLVRYGGDVGSDPHVHGGIMVARSCETHKQEDGDQATRCAGSSVTSLRASDRFEIGLDASSASLKAPRGRYVHRLSWTATDDGYGSAWWAEACSQGQGEGMGVVRFADARGRLFGRKVNSAGPNIQQFHVLVHGATVTQCFPAMSEAEITDLFDGGSVSLTY